MTSPSTPTSTRGYRGRLAPSPTGKIHLGTARTSLVAWLRARAAGGRLILRMEDLDGPRVVPGAAEAMLDDLAWLGLDWDEGPDVGGPSGVYVQSARESLYVEAWQRLRERGYIYPCTCTRREVAMVSSAPHGQAPRYPGTCREGPRHADRTAAWRFRMPEPPPTFVDGLHGLQGADGTGDADFVVRRADALFAYQLAVVVDDAAMGITEVVRGDDLLTSTPGQLALYAALGLPAPAFFHVPLVLGPDGERLAKRHGAVAIADYRSAGTTAEQLIGALAFSLGLLADATPCSTQALLDRFDPARLPREPHRWLTPFI